MLRPSKKLLPLIKIKIQKTVNRIDIKFISKKWFNISIRKSKIFSPDRATKKKQVIN